MDSPEAKVRPRMNELSSLLQPMRCKSTMPQLSWEAFLNEKVAIALGTIPTARVQDITENPRRAVEDCPKDRRIDDEAKAAKRQLVTKELTTLIKEHLDYILPTLYHKAQNDISSVVCGVLKQEWLEIFQKTSLMRLLMHIHREALQI